MYRACHTGRGSCAWRRGGKGIFGEDTYLVKELLEPSVDNAEMVVVVFGLLRDLGQLLVCFPLLAAILLHLTQNGVFLVVLNAQTQSVIRPGANAMMKGMATHLDLLLLVIGHLHRGAVFVLQTLATRRKVIDVAHDGALAVLHLDGERWEGSRQGSLGGGHLKRRGCSLKRPLRPPVVCLVAHAVE